jgi:DnaK suppressor protein
MDQEQLDSFRKTLTDRLKALLAEAGATIGSLTDERENLADDIDLASMESNRDFLLRIRDRERTLIHKIQKALHAMDEGEYGICAACGGDISMNRLLARPVATHCIDCKTEAEQLERRSRSF